ncbi:reverse transcriptase domain-containing protein [Tanacetum coccineum]
MVVSALHGWNMSLVVTLDKCMTSFGYPNLLTNSTRVSGVGGGEKARWQPLFENHKDTNGGGGESIQALTKHLTPRILEANPLLILIILKTFECLRLHTLHAKPWENEFESFSGQRLSEYIRQLILCPHEIQLNHSFFHLFSDEMMSDVDVFRPGVLNVVAAPITYDGRATPGTQEGYGEAIVLPEINADHFEIKTNLLQLVQANPFYGRESENPHAHINSFKRITSTLRFRNVPNDVIKLMMFPYSLEGAAKTWYEKEPPNSILTWEDLVTKFVNQFFPPSKTTHLKNEISRFTQKFEETFSEAWERFKELLRACPHHGFTELTQVDTFYNGLNENEQDSLNAAAGGNLLSKMTREALNIIENKSKVRYSRNRSNASRMNATSSKTDERIDKLADQLST